MVLVSDRKTDVDAEVVMLLLVAIVLPLLLL